MTREEAFLAHLESHVQAAFKHDALQSFREHSWQRFLSQGLPSKSHLGFEHVPLKDLYKHSFTRVKAPLLTKPAFQHLIFPSCEQNHLVFINGHFVPELSVCADVSVQMQGWELGLNEKTDPFALLNFALGQEGARFIISSSCAAFLQILFLNTIPSPQIAAPRLQGVLEAGSRLNCIVTAHSLIPEASHLNLPVVDFLLEEGAQLHLTHQLSSDWTMASIHATLKKKAQLHSVALTEGGICSKHNYIIHLEEDGAMADLRGLSVLKDAQTAHTQVLIEHEAPTTHSMQLFKGVLKERSQSSFLGRILVHPQAQKTEAYQLHKTLLLSPQAIVHSQPQLEIQADDVKASHGATVSQLDDKQLFYLRARGLSHELASELLVQGFCQDVLEGIAKPGKKAGFFGG